jgi:hypothetical protein
MGTRIDAGATYARGVELANRGRYADAQRVLAEASAAAERAGDPAAAVSTGMTLAFMTTVVGALNPLTLALGALTAAIGAEFTVLLLAADRARDGALRRSVWLAALLSVGGYGVLMASSLPVLRELGLGLTTSVVLSVTTAFVDTALRARVRRRGDSVAQGQPAQPAQPASTTDETDVDADRLQPTGGAR